MPERLDPSTGSVDNIDGYPWSWPRPLPMGSEIDCPLTRDALRIAEAMAKRRFFYHPDCDDLVRDAVSYSWELSQQTTYRQRGHAGSIAAFAVKRVASGRQFAESTTSLTRPHSKQDDRPQRCSFFNHTGFSHLGSAHDVSPTETVLFRLDLTAWLDTLTTRQREVALLLATGHTTTDIAEQSGCTTNAIRMIRAVLRHRYDEFLREGDNHRAE